MASSKTRSVCFICLKRFGGTGFQHDGASYQCRLLVPYTGLSQGTVLSPEDPLGTSTEEERGREPLAPSSADIFTKFLMVVRRYLKIPMAETFILYAKDHKKATGEDTPAFCDQCQELVGYMCDLYSELHAVKLHLLKKVEELENVTKNATKKVSQKLSRGLLKTISEQLHAKSIRQMELFRKTFLLGCQKKVKGSTPQILVHRGLFPEEWKYSYVATKQSLIHLITVFALATISKSEPRKEPTGILKRGRKKLDRRSDGRNVSFGDVGNRLFKGTRFIKQEHGIAIKKELAGGEGADVPSGDENGFDGYEGDGGFPDTGGDDNDSDWSGGAASPAGSMDSAESDVDEQPASRRRLRRTSRRLSTGSATGDPDENGSDEGSDDDANDPEFKGGVGARRKVGRPPKVLKAKRRKVSEIRKDATLPCKICKRMFIDRRGLAKHSLVVHNTQLDYFCEICGLKCVSQKEYGIHKQNSHPEFNVAPGSNRDRAKATLPCPKCNIKFIDTRGLSKHMLRKHSSRLEYTCTVCGHKSSSAADHVKHRSKYHRKRSYAKRPMGLGIQKIRRQMGRECRECDLQFPTRMEYLKHCKDIHTIRRYRFECPMCMAQIVNDQRFQRHLAMHQDDSAVLRVFHCEVCGKTHYNEEELSAHFQEEHQGSYNCALCDSKLTTSKLLRAHLEIHETETKNFPCNFCFRSYTNEQYWQIHRKVAHVGNERIFCDEYRCPAEFSSVQDLNEHLAMHLKDAIPTSTDEQESEQEKDESSKTIDDNCGAEKTDDSNKVGDTNTNEHTDNTNSEDNRKEERQIFRCEKCGWGFLTKNRLVLHELGHIPYEADLGYRCPKEGCDKILRLKDKLITHFSFKHGDKYKPYECHECKGQFSSFIWYKTHLRLHAERDSGKRFICNLCQTECIDSIQLNDHKRTHRTSQLKHVEVAAQMTGDLPPEELGPDGKPRKRRGRPGWKLRTEEELSKLKEKREKEEKVPCQVCNITCVSAHRLRKHLESQHELVATEEEKKIQCYFCSMKFAYEQTHQLHCVSLHMQKYRFVCDADNCLISEFPSMTELNEHLRTTHLITSEENGPSEQDTDAVETVPNNVEPVPTTGEEAKPVPTTGEEAKPVPTTGEEAKPVPTTGEEAKQVPTTEKGTPPNSVVKVKSLSFCSLCGWGFVSSDIRELHELVHIPCLSNNCYACPGCEKTFPSTSRLTSHFNVEHGNKIKPWKCSECPIRFTSKQGLKLHLARHKVRESGETHLCFDCGKEFKDPAKFRLHRQIHDPSSHVICPEGCGEKFLNKPTLHVHLRKKHGKGDRYPCPICGQVFIYTFEVKKHVEWVHGEAKYVCDICGRKYKRPNALKMHKKTHDPNGCVPFVCAECGNQYKTEEGLKYHVGSVHTPQDMKRFACPHCPYKSHRPMLFRMHLKCCLKSRGLPYDEEKWGKLPQVKVNTGPPRKPGRKPGWTRKKKKVEEEDEEMDEKTTTEEEEDEEDNEVEEEEKPSTSQNLSMPTLYPHLQPQLTPGQSPSSGSVGSSTINNILMKLTGIPNLTPEVEQATVTRRGRKIKKPNRDFGTGTTSAATTSASTAPAFPSTTDSFQYLAQEQGLLPMPPHPQLFGNNHGTHYQSWLTTTSAGGGSMGGYTPSLPQLQESPSQQNSQGYTPSPPPLQHHSQLQQSNVYSPNHVYSPPLPNQPQNLHFGGRK